MRYTSEATMDDRSFRDVERWKDKIEVRLDNRQVFVLFFGSALVACLLFILGVIVGKRLESRGRAVAPEIEDPLALLDKVTSRPPPATGFSSTKPKPSTRAEAREPTPGPQANGTARKPAPAVLQAVVAKPEAAPAAEKPEAAPPGAARPERNGDGVGERGGKARFALQIGSFPDRPAADAFARRFGADSPYVVQSDIPGKGIWFRVRMGAYPSAKEALEAKAAFEKQHGVIAFVVPSSAAARTETVKTSVPR